MSWPVTDIAELGPRHYVIIGEMLAPWTSIHTSLGRRMLFLLFM